MYSFYKWERCHILIKKKKKKMPIVVFYMSAREKKMYSGAGAGVYIYIINFIHTITLYMWDTS